MASQRRQYSPWEFLMPAPSSPDVAHHRARVGALSRDRSPDDPEFLAAKRDLTAANLEAHIAKVIAAVPTLTTEQRSHIADLLRCVNEGD
jgi:hypothetical protein